MDQGPTSPNVHIGLPESLAKRGFVERRKDGVTFIEPPICDVPAGTFLMGSDPDHDPHASKIEQPLHMVELPMFRIARFPVTVAEYACAVRAGAVRSPSEDMFTEQWSAQVRMPERPVVNVRWHEAVRYAEWLEQMTGKVWRLPTEAEWEKAARGPNQRIYPWGDVWEPDRANTLETGWNELTPVYMYPKGVSPYGVEDMIGNATEWTSSIFKLYPYVPPDGREEIQAKGMRVFRGGSYSDVARNVRIAFRPFVSSEKWPQFYHGVRLAVGL